MAKELDKKQTVDLKELLMSEVIQSEALINIPDRKGIIEMKKVQASMVKSEK